MPFSIDIDTARTLHPDYEFIGALTPSAQKAAFHVRRDGKDLCLKIIAPNQALERVQREVLAMQTISHPNVAKVIEYEYSARAGTTRHFLVEEFVDGSDLGTRMIGGTAWPLADIKSIFVPLCEGLTALANSHIVHRDLKPSNIRIRPTGQPVIIDFGLARMLDMESLTATTEGARLGTPRYFSPEQVRGTKTDIDHRTDLYALGVMLYEAAVGKHPSPMKDMMTFDELENAVCDNVDFALDPGFSTLPTKLQLVLRRLLEKERGRRPASASLVGTLLSSIEVT